MAKITRLLGQDDLAIEDSTSIITFGYSSDSWYRFINVDGKPAFEIGNVCGTCEFYFRRLGAATQSVHPAEMIQQLNDGLTVLDRNIVERVSAIVPNGRYKVLLLRVYPKLVEPGTENDYFSNEQLGLWDIAEETRNDPEIDYYRGTDQPIRTDEKVFEFLVPLFPHTQLDEERARFYGEQISAGKTPTAISLSVLDVKIPANSPPSSKPEFAGHWCLAHYILDGHHKTYAAAQLNMGMNVLCFLTTTVTGGTEGDIETLIHTI